MKSAIFLSIIAFLSSTAHASKRCDSHIRIVHGNPFEAEAVEVSINNKKWKQTPSFSEISDYLAVKPGKKTVEFHSAKDGRLLGSKTFVAGSNLGYTIVLGGPATGPKGMLFGSESPFVILDDITPVSNPERWKGQWYRMSETNVVIDFRVKNVDQKSVMAKLFAKPNRSVYQLGDFPAGRYTFNPLLQGSEDALLNPALQPAAYVELNQVEVQGGTNFDVIALGNFLGQAPNSLRLTGHLYKTQNLNGCLVPETIKKISQ